MNEKLIDALAYEFWSVHPSQIDKWEMTAPLMPPGYNGGVRAWFYACHMRELVALPEDWFDAEERREQKLATIVAPDNGTPSEVLSAVLECARAWVPEARIIGNVRAGDIARAIETITSTPSQGESVAQDTAPQVDVVPEELRSRTFSAHYNPNCPSPWLVRIPGKSGVIDFLPYSDPLRVVRHQTGDILGFGHTLHAAGLAALAATEVSAK